MRTNERLDVCIVVSAHCALLHQTRAVAQTSDQSGSPSDRAEIHNRAYAQRAGYVGNVLIVAYVESRSVALQALPYQFSLPIADDYPSTPPLTVEGTCVAETKSIASPTRNPEWRGVRISLRNEPYRIIRPL